MDFLIKGEYSNFDSKSANSSQIPNLEQKKINKKINNKKRGWFFISYPIIAIIAYLLIGYFFQDKGWATGWIILLTIPLFYTSILAFEKRNPVIFCYPVLALIVFLLAGFFLDAWHPAWILFLTIPIFYIAAISSNKKKNN